MKKFVKSLILLLVVSTSFASTTLVWNKKPLDITLPVDKQIYISFPDHVDFGLPDDLKGKISVQNSNSVLYLTALEPFQTHQLKVRTANNQIILINFTAQDKASVEPINVIFPEAPVKKEANPFQSNEISLQHLMQYAIQHYYAPTRLLEDNPDIKKTMSFNNQEYKLFADNSVTAIPLDSFSADNQYVTAIYIKNNTNKELNLVELDTQGNLLPVDICGTWVGSAFFPISKLDPVGQDNDSTMLFLVSDNDFISTYKGTCALGDDHES